MNIKLAHDTIERHELDNLSDWIRQDNQLTKGPLTVEFEKKFADYIGSKYAVFVNSGSSANLVMMYALAESGKLKNKKIVVPAVSWITTLSPAIQLGFEVILCDADPNTLGIDLNHFEEICKKHEPALVITVDVLGHLNDYDRVNEICEKYGVDLVVDGCESLGSSFPNGKKVGTFGLATSFSFYYGHHISTIEGGMVTTDNRDLYNIILSIRSHGWARDIELQYQQDWKKEYEVDEFSNFYTFYYGGFNLRSTDLNAFLGLSQLQKMDAIAQKRQSNYLAYKKHLGDRFWFQSSKFETLSSFSYGTLIKNRLEVASKLKEAGVESRPLICGSMGRQPFWIKKYGVTPLPMADKVHFSGIYLPNHFHLSEDEIAEVSQIFSSVAIPL